MAIQSIGSVVNASFIRSFQGLASSGGPAIGAGAGQGATIGNGLRLGARTFATAIQNLNATIGIVNVADDTLKKLSAITDKMIDIAERGTSLSAGSETRRGLESEFKDLTTEFRKIVDSSTLNSVEYLTQTGLVGLFQRIGLDKETSEGVATIFKHFSKTAVDDDLVSEATKGKRPAEIPVLRRTRISQVSNSNISANGAGVAPDYTTYTDSNGSGYTQPYSVDLLGSTSSQVGVTQNQEVLAVNESKGNSGETSGYTLIKSTQDLTSNNPSGYEQVFVVDPDGSVIRQVTNISVPGVTINAADISADNKTVAVSYNNGTDQVDIISVSSIGDPPASSTLVENDAVTATAIKLSNDGQYIAYNDAGDLKIKLVGGATDSYLVGAHSIENFGFADSDTILFQNTSGEVYSYDFASSDENLIISDSTIVNFTVLESDSTYSNNDGSLVNTPNNATIAYVRTTATGNQLTVSSYDINASTLKTRFRRELGTGSVDRISLSYQDDLNKSKDRVDVGVVGTLSTISGDSDREMYRITESRFATNSSLFAQASEDPANVLDGNVLTRADSFRLLGDLKALKQQMSDNIDALAGAREYLASNVSLVRAAGFAFLDVSNQLTGSEDAALVAQMVSTQIRQNASSAIMAQAENLRNIASETVGLLS